MAVGLFRDVMIDQELLLLFSIDTLADGTDCMLRRTSEAVTQCHLSIGSDTH
jgi:hypothetical protein